MYEKTRKGIEDLIEKLTEKVNNEAIDPKERQELVSQISTLTKLLIENEKNDMEFSVREDEIRKNEALKQEEMENEKKHRLITYILTGSTTLLTVGVFVWQTAKGYILEETGSYTSKTLQWLLGSNKLKLK